MNEDVDATQSEIRNGSPLDPAARPYENLMVYVSGCGGLLLGNSSGTASYVLTARHCTDDGLPAIRRPDGSIPGGGAKRVIQHPLALAGGDDTVDAALVELKRPEPTTSRVTFSNLTPQELAGQQARCYGAGNIENYGINTGVFTLAIDHRAPNSSIYYDVVLPNELGQYVSKGDSGGPCVRVTGTQDTTVFGINKAGDKYTFARQTAAVAFSEWVRTYVPR
ncbi:MAG TPA: trypsin-like serine protease [Polyangiaceae bacterium]|nr:trypsin-like serine protease [Polyangiaceae bacterium]